MTLEVGTREPASSTHTLLRQRPPNFSRDFIRIDVHHTPVLRRPVVLDPSDLSVGTNQDKRVTWFAGGNRPLEHTIGFGDRTAVIGQHWDADAIALDGRGHFLGRIEGDAQQRDAK